MLTGQGGTKSFSGEKTISAGWYQLTLKSVSAIVTFVSTKTMKVGVGEVFIIAGQSNAQGLPNKISNENVVNLPLLDAVRVQPDKFIGADFLTATDPNSIQLATQFNVRKPVFSPLTSGKEAYGNQNSGIAPLGNSLWYWVAFGEKIANQYKIPVALFNAAWGGITIKAWQESTNPAIGPLGAPIGTTNNYDPGAPYGVFKNTLQFYGSTYGVRAVLWLQGETDAKALRESAWEEQRINSANEYKDKLVAVISKSREHLPPRVGDDPLAWMVGKTSTLEGVSFFYHRVSPRQTEAETQSTILVRAGQEQVITASGLSRIYRGPDIDVIPERASGGGEPTHLAGQGLVKAADAWFSAIQTSNLLLTDPIRPARLGTEPQDVYLDANGNITTPLPPGAQYVWFSGNGGRVDLNSPAGFGTTMPDGITDPLVCIDYGNGTCALGGLVLPDANTTTEPPITNPPTGSGPLAFQIVSYDCNTGVLQYRFNSNDNSPVSVTLPGIFGGTMNPNTVATHTFPGDARQGRTITGTASQGGSQINIQFTNGCNMQGGTTDPGTPNPPTGSGSCSVSNPNSALDFADCNGVSGWALDQNNLSQPVTYDIYVDGVKTYSGLTATGDRQDLVPHFGNNPAARYHGFQYQFPANASWKNGQNHTISVRICGVNGDMNGSPKTVSGCTGGSQTQTPPPTTNPPSGSGPLTFQIVSYNCNTGVLQYRFNSSNNSPVNVTLPGIFGGTMNPNTVATHTFPADARQGRTVTGTASQDGSQVNIQFTNGCNLSGGTTEPPQTPPSGSGSLTFQVVSYDCGSGVLQYRFNSSNNSAVSVTLPGIFGGTMNPNTTATHTFPGDARQGRTVTGTASQGGNQINIQFTNGCNMSGGRKASTVTVEPTVGEVDLLVRPNPSSGQFELEFVTSLNAAYAVQITNLLGHVLWQSDGIGTGYKETKAVDLQGKFVGSAVVTVHSNGKRASKLILIKP
ncbi:hypothetical protein AWR27_15580 [Spirosoma montaniterrae]|uniref:Sialate O-acetylesterase domain-containing protein n=2 Tax=Spirosoma montaniterrae TaxID=1178516 RepID=A0A1P9WZ22_9BACT|nr:hypothetical protein AWR27_15580 [Spirosoma montaniterrae]